jgi:hypothetical protein
LLGGALDALADFAIARGLRLAIDRNAALGARGEARAASGTGDFGAHAAADGGTVRTSADFGIASGFSGAVDEGDSGRCAASSEEMRGNPTFGSEIILHNIYYRRFFSGKY